MVWTLMPQQQQCGAQLHARSDPSTSSGTRRPGEAPREAVAGRAAQDHEQAGETLPPGDYPASPLEDRDDDITPSAPAPDVEWDEVVQPERQPPEGKDFDDLPLPEGK